MKLLFVKTLRKLTLSFFALIIVSGTLFSFTLINPTKVSAQATCGRVGQCVNDKRCICIFNPGDPFWHECNDPNNTDLFIEGPDDCGSAIIGAVTPPGSIADINSAADGDIGLVSFLSRVINFANIVAGILIMLNFVHAGFLYVTGAGSSSSMAKINERLTWSFVGIMLVVGSYTIAAIFGLVFYGDPTFIIAPTFTGALEL